VRRRIRIRPEGTVDVGTLTMRARMVELSH
jgi:hypothetical protein